MLLVFDILIPNVSLIVTDIKGIQHGSEFILECLPTMMFLLTLNVTSHTLNMRLADRENSVPILPRELPQIYSFGLHPL